MLVGGLVAFGVHKMSQKDADRIEQHTGVNPEELEDDELEKAMAELGIADEKLSEADLAAADATAAAPPGPAGGGTSSDLDQLTQLASLRDAGILTEEEFTAKKAQILGLD